MFFNETIHNPIAYDSQPRSLVLADFNQDNQLDVTVALYSKHSVGIFFGDNNGHISHATNYSTGAESYPYSVTVADFNQDNFIDIAVANYGTLCIGIFLGQRNGTFQNQTIFSTDNSHPIFITVEDFNNDTKQDIIVINYGTDSISIYLGNGNGIFTNRTSYFTGYDSTPCSLAVADLNNDNKLDFVVANYGTDDIVIYFGYGNGSFIYSKTYLTTHGSNPHSITVADLNNDHQTDIIIANQGMQNIGIFYGYGNGSFEKQVMHYVGIKNGPDYVAIGDINNDKQNDIVIIDTTNSFIHVLPGYGNGTFFDLKTFFADTQNHQFAVAIGDFNSDNQSDIAVVNYGTNDILILTGCSFTYSVTQTSIPVGRNSRPSFIAVGDFNSDQFLDIVISKISSDSVGVLLNYGNGDFANELSYALPYGSSPQCVSTGDFNSDSRTDVVVANYGSHTIGILFGDGNGSFSSMIAYSTGNESYPIFVAVADFNNDSVLDIAVVNFLLDNVVIFLGYVNGSFAEKMTYSTGTGSNPKAIVIDDFDNDTHLDLAVANSENWNVGILFSNGDGTFRTIITYSTGFQTHPDSVVTGDFNHDHWSDIVIVDSSSDYVAFLFGNGNGTFEEPIMYRHDSFSNPSGLAVVDLDADKNLDLLISNRGTDNIAVLAGYGNGSFYLGDTYALVFGSGITDIVLADFRNTTQWDIAAVLSGVGSINILVRYAQAQFQTVEVYSTGGAEHPYAIVSADFNHDNQSDIAVTNVGADTVDIFLGYEDGSFTSKQTYSTGLHSRPQHLAVGDFNRDNHLDIVTANGRSTSFAILYGNENGHFDVTLVTAIEFGSQPCWVATADFNNDQRLDFIVANQGTDGIEMLLSYDYNTFKPQITYSNQYTIRPTSIIARDLNNDTYIDIIASFSVKGNVGIYYGYGNGTFGDFITYSIGYNSYPYEIIDIDVNNDDILDLVVANMGSSSLGVLLGYKNKTFAPVMSFSTGNNSRPYGVAAGDFNNDHYMDIVVANYYINSIGILLGYGNGSFATVVLYSTEDGSRPQSVAVGDFNQDNGTDIVVANYLRDCVGVFLGNGDGTFQPQIIFSTGYRSMPTYVIANDFDNDGKMDVAVTNKNNNDIGILYGYGNGSFAPIITYSAGDGTSPQCLRAGDFNNDQQTDIAIISPGTNSIMILYALGDRRFIVGPSFSAGTKSGVLSLAVGDFDNDNKLDITTANNLVDTIGVYISDTIQSFGGIKTFSVASGSQPYSIAASDFNNDGQSDVAVANYGTNEIGILLGDGNGELFKMVPYSMGNNARPVALTVGDLNMDNRTDIVVVNSGSNHVSVLLGDGQGNFSIIATYGTGDLSNPQSVTLADLNNDKILDMIVTTGGTSLILLTYGYGNGTFGNETTYKMGYNYNPRGVGVGDFNRDSLPDIAVANYGADNVEIFLQSCENQ